MVCLRLCRGELLFPRFFAIGDSSEIGLLFAIFAIFVETPTIGRPEAWPGAAMWQQRDPTLDLDGLDHLGQGPLVSPSAYW